jgi:DNA invertase Pin-like site-specific DNA recombinase
MTTMIGYLRVSTEEQANSGLGLEAQRDTIQRYADAHDWNLVWYEDAGLSAKSLARPQLRAALDRLNVASKRRDVGGIVVAKLDRLSRSVGLRGRAGAGPCAEVGACRNRPGRGHL